MTKEKVQELKSLLELMRKMISIDIYYGIYDENCIVQYIYPEDGQKNDIYVGEVFCDPNGTLKKAMETGECIHDPLMVGKQGLAVEGNIVPVYEDGKICGAVSAAYQPMNQQHLTARELAVQSIYYLLMSIDAGNYRCKRLFFNNAKHNFPLDAQFFDVFCNKILQDIHPDDREDFQKFTDLTNVLDVLQEQRSIMLECRLLDRMQEYRWMEIEIVRVEEFVSPENDDKFLFMVRDIHDRKAKEIAMLEENQKLILQLRSNNRALQEQNMIDEMTQLYNRRGFMYSTTELLQAAKKNNQYIYIFMADLNGLKYINDKFGHERGDMAIQTVAKILRQVMPETAIISRIGGDEFLVADIMEGNSGVPEKIERAYVEKVREYNSKSGLPYLIEASYGWECRLSTQIENIEECIDSADKKMYQMKAQRRVPGSFSQTAQDEISRRFGSARKRVMIYSQSPSVQEEITRIFDDSYIVTPWQSAEAVLQELEKSDEIVMLFVDHYLEHGTGMQFIQQFPEHLREKTILLLLLEDENVEMLHQAFNLGLDDVLVRPYCTELNKCHMSHLFRMNVANRNLSRLLMGGQGFTKA